MRANRAPKGGCIGVNGEFYKGGTFLPQTALPKQATRAYQATGKREIWPFQWASPAQTIKLEEGEKVRSYDGYFRLISGQPVQGRAKVLDYTFSLQSDRADMALKKGEKEGRSKAEIIRILRDAYDHLMYHWRRGEYFRAVIERPDGSTREVFFA